mgnify:CR=1 FL=1
MTGNLVITIGRECGSGGRLIGNRLAEKLNIKCYDKELLTLAAKKSGLCEEIFESHDEKPTSSFLYSLVMDSYSMGYSTSSFIDMPLNHKVFLAQFDAIKSIAKEGPCVLVGRCADYALHDMKNCLHFFIYADEETKIKRLVKKYPDLNESKARDMMVKKDKQRQSYYNYYSSKKWGRADSYDFCLNSSILGIDGTVKLITQIIEDFEQKEQ